MDSNMMLIILGTFHMSTNNCTFHPLWYVKIIKIQGPAKSFETSNTLKNCKISGSHEVWICWKRRRQKKDGDHTWLIIEKLGYGNNIYQKTWNGNFVIKRRNWGTLDILQVCNFSTLYFLKICQFRKRQGPKNDEDPSDHFLKILNMGPISSWEYEMIFWEHLIPIIYNRRFRSERSQTKVSKRDI